jgi:hypothetical protein
MKKGSVIFLIIEFLGLIAAFACVIIEIKNKQYIGAILYIALFLFMIYNIISMIRNIKNK